MGLDQPSNVSRRTLLQAAAGGFTFLTLAPGAKALTEFGEDAPTRTGSPQPIFTALPYLQPGTRSSRLVPGQESIVIAWQTNGVPAEYEVHYGSRGLDRVATINSQLRFPAERPELDQRINHAASLTGLDLGKRYRYRVNLNGQPLIDGYFTTRKPRGTKTRFVAFGDNSFGDPSDKAIAFQAYQAKPDFVMNTGDNVYDSGLDNEYVRYFFPVYNAEEAHIRIGAPLLRAVPFYSVIANHDLNGRDPKLGVLVDFDKNADAGGYYTNMHLPNNAPVPTSPTIAVGKGPALELFRKVAGNRFPNMANYSYDYGDAHFTCLDSNVYVDPTDPALQDWIRADITGSDAAWKFVVYHHPAFNAGDSHYDAQHMRALAPMFEELGVDMVLSGHEHTYQRSMPFRFAPRDLTNAKARNGNTRKVPGTFTVDREFDGKTNTKPNGVIYIVTGAGGKHLYDPGYSDNPSLWRHPEDDNVEYVARFVSDRHSITVFDLDAKSLLMRQIDEWGTEVDRIRITKA